MQWRKQGLTEARAPGYIPDLLTVMPDGQCVAHLLTGQIVERVIETVNNDSGNSASRVHFSMIDSG